MTLSLYEPHTHSLSLNVCLTIHVMMMIRQSFLDMLPPVVTMVSQLDWLWDSQSGCLPTEHEYCLVRVGIIPRWGPFDLFSHFSYCSIEDINNYFLHHIIHHRGFQP